MNDRSEISSPQTSPATDSATSSAVLESGRALCKTPDGLTPCQSGPDQPLVSLGPVPANGKGTQTNGTSGLSGSDSFENAVRLLSSENKSPVRVGIAGLTRSPMILKELVTVFQQTKFQLRQLEHHIGGNASTSSRSSADEKTCSKCDLVKPLHEFGTDTTRGCFRFRSECRTCAAQRHWLARMEKSGKAPTKPRSYQAKENAKSYSSLYRARYPVRALIGHARNRARQKKLPFDLCEEDILPAFEAGRCQVTGITFVMDPPRNPRSPSLDRIDSKKGYVKENVRLVLAAINWAMGTWGLGELEAIIREWKGV